MAAYWRNLVTVSLTGLLFFAIAERSPPVALAYSSFKKKLTPIPFPNATDPDPPKPWTCDISSGSWTPSANLPLYTGLTCPYIRSGHNCQSAGRSDMSYQKLRWRPWGCKVVQLTPPRLLTLFRNKAVVVFGDSVSKDLSTSLRCMLPRSHHSLASLSFHPPLPFHTTALGPWGCRVVQLTPQRLLNLFRNKTVVVFGDSVSKDLSTSLRCMLHAASPNFSRFKLAGGETRVWGEKVEPQNIRIVSLFSSHLNDIGFIPDASQPPSAAAAAAGVDAAAAGAGGVGANGAGAGRGVAQAQQQARRVFLDQIDPKIKDLLPKADIVIFQATNWWYAEDNQWFLGGKQQKISRSSAYAIGLATLRDHVARSGFQGKAVVMGVSPSHYIVPVPGIKKGKCDVNSRLDWNQTKEARRMDTRSFEMRKVQLQVVTPESKIVCTGVKLE
ncbi:unnamed protein product [Closterium sp. Naga37s-1]|nr:unnamed protein product [Closterium sp. Naga37s-1]